MLTHKLICVFPVEHALAENKKEMEKDAQRKMEKAISKEKQWMQQELDVLKRDKQQSDEQKHLAEEARTTAERARALADEEQNLADQERDKKLQNGNW